MATDEQRQRWREEKRSYRRRLKLLLVALLGGKCQDCPETDPDRLEFDHLQPREWQSRDVWSQTRLMIYKREIEEGKIELRCRSCNARKGAPPAAANHDDDDEIGPDEEPGPMYT